MKKFILLITILCITGCSSKPAESNLPISNELKSFVVTQSTMINDAVMNDHGVKTNDISEILKFVQYNDPEIKDLNKTETKMINMFRSYSARCINVSGADKLDIVECVKMKKELDEIVK